MSFKKLKKILDLVIVGPEYLSIFAAANRKYTGLPVIPGSGVHVGKWWLSVV